MHNNDPLAVIVIFGALVVIMVLLIWRSIVRHRNGSSYDYLDDGE